MPYTPTNWIEAVTTLGPTHLNNLETGVSKAPYGPDASASNVPIWNGSAWTYGLIADANISASAAIAASKLAGSIPASKLANYPSNTTTFLRGDGTWVSPNTSYRKTTTKTISNTVTETDLLNAEITVAAGALGTTGSLRLKAWGSLQQNSLATTNFPRLKLKLGATVLMDSGAGPAQMLTSASLWGWDFEAIILNAGATNSQVCKMKLDMGASTSTAASVVPTVGTGVYSSTPSDNAWFNIVNNGLAVDTTSAQALALTVINPAANASVQISLYGALVEVI